jgi:hypothetical protein
MKIGGTDMIIEVYEDTEWIDDEVTHVITSMDEQHLCKRTQKYLNAIVKGKWVLGHQCESQGKLTSKWNASDILSCCYRACAEYNGWAMA